MDGSIKKRLEDVKAALDKAKQKREELRRQRQQQSPLSQSPEQKQEQQQEQQPQRPQLEEPRRKQLSRVMSIRFTRLEQYLDEEESTPSHTPTPTSPASTPTTPHSAPTSPSPLSLSSPSPSHRHSTAKQLFRELMDDSNLGQRFQEKEEKVEAAMADDRWTKNSGQFFATIRRVPRGEAANQTRSPRSGDLPASQREFLESIGKRRPSVQRAGTAELFSSPTQQPLSASAESLPTSKPKAATLRGSKSSDTQSTSPRKDSTPSTQPPSPRTAVNWNNPDPHALKQVVRVQAFIRRHRAKKREF